MIISYLKKYIFLFIISLSFCACGNYKKIAYFRDLQDSAKSQTISTIAYKELIIKSDDILSVTIQTIDPQNASSINQVTTAPVVEQALGTSTEGAPVMGYLVDREGNIELPMLGKIKLAGLTTLEAREFIKRKVSVFYKEPTIQVRFANFKITVLGEVARPAPYILPNEKLTVLDAIGLAGDLTVYGKRENVMLIRENNGKKDVYRFNLNSSDTFRSPAFYLQQNDIIYVEADKVKAASLNTVRTQNIAIMSSIISVLFIVITRF